MNLFKIAFKSIKQRGLSSSLTSLSVALGVMLMVTVIIIYSIINTMFNQKSIGYDLIVGATGSELELVLNSVYRLGKSSGNLPYRYYLKLKDDPRVEEAIPIALGDVTEKGGFPIVGTKIRYFELEYAPGKKFQCRGEGFNEKSLHALIGYEVARKNNWDIGAKFKLVHGGADSDHHHDEEFKVVGVLEPTGTANDKTVFIPLDAFYNIAGHGEVQEKAEKYEREFFGNDYDKIMTKYTDEKYNKGFNDHSGHNHGHDDHGHEPMTLTKKEVSSVYLRMDTPASSLVFASNVNKSKKALAVNPIIPMKRMMDQIVGNIRTILLFLTGLIILVSGVGIFVSIYNSMSDRKKEIAIMRALGANRQTVFSVILLESSLLCCIGGVLGILLGHGLVFAISPIVAERSGILMNPYSFEPVELIILPVMIILASLIGFIPGMTAYKTDVAETLSS